MLAMYSATALTQNPTTNSTKGFIASLTNKKIYTLLKSNKNAKIKQYNQYYL
jgi:hypothetical protein